MNKRNGLPKILKFYHVSRPYCDPPCAYTFAYTKKEALSNVNKKYGFTDGKATEIKQSNEFVS